VILRIDGYLAHKQGYDAKPAEVVAYKPGQFIVLKSPGEHYWRDRLNPSAYAPAVYDIHPILEEMPDGRVRIDNVPVLGWPVTATQKSREDVANKLAAHGLGS